MFEQIPTRFKAAIAVGVVLAGPLILFSILFSGVQAAMIAVLALVVYFTTIYIIGVRRFMRGK